MQRISIVPHRNTARSIWNNKWELINTVTGMAEVLNNTALSLTLLVHCRLNNEADQAICLRWPPKSMTRQTFYQDLSLSTPLLPDMPLGTGPPQQWIQTVNSQGDMQALESIPPFLPQTSHKKKMQWESYLKNKLNLAYLCGQKKNQGKVAFYRLIIITLLPSLLIQAKITYFLSVIKQVIHEYIGDSVEA